MTLRHGKTHRQPLLAGSYLKGPCPTSREICDTPMKTLQAFQGHGDHRKPTLGATSTVRGKIDESKEIVQEIKHIFSSRGITFAHTVFLAHCEFICNFGTLRKKTCSATTCNSRISKIFPGRAVISVRKLLSITGKQSGSLCLRGHISQAQARPLVRFVTLRRRHRKLTRDTKIIENRHWELVNRTRENRRK